MPAVAYSHQFDYSYDEDGDIAFSMNEIRRNVLGRDFFDLVQIGFREHHLALFVTPSP